MVDLPITKPYLKCHTHKSRYADTSRVAYTRGAQTKLAILSGHIIRNLGKRTDVHQTTQQTLPEDDDANDVEVWNEVEQGV